MTSADLIRRLDERYLDYLHDESGLRGTAQSISFPTSEAEVLLIVDQMRRSDVPITVQGGRTGLAGAAVPTRGHVMNLSRMKCIGRPHLAEDGTWLVTAEPGATLDDLRHSLAGARVGQALFWPPDPTEATATIGGVVAGNARGLTSALYGSTREHVAALRLLAQGDAAVDVRPGDWASGLGCRRELLDLAAGGEGMLGVMTSLTLKLSVSPRVIWGVCFFCADRERACAVADALAAEVRPRGGEPAGAQPPSGAGIACLEYLDRQSIDLVGARKSEVPALRRLPGVDPAAYAMIYAELHGAAEDDVVALAGRLMDVATAHGSDPDAWALCTEAEVDRLRAFRHAVPETANMRAAEVRAVHPEVVALTTDMSLPGLSFAAALDFYEAGLRGEGLAACIYGPLCDNRLYVSLMPRTHDEFIRGRRLVEEWAVRAVSLGGRPVNEHGVGKLKRRLLAVCPAADRRDELLRCKQALDPAGFWNPGNMI